eukprot:s14_g6.t1
MYKSPSKISHLPPETRETRREIHMFSICQRATAATRISVVFLATACVFVKKNLVRLVQAIQIPGAAVRFKGGQSGKFWPRLRGAVALMGRNNGQHCVDADLRWRPEIFVAFSCRRWTGKMMGACTSLASHDLFLVTSWRRREEELASGRREEEEEEEEEEEGGWVQPPRSYDKI